jgi:hypothetical protein
MMKWKNISIDESSSKTCMSEVEITLSDSDSFIDTEQALQRVKWNQVYHTTKNI